jgi:O-antigen/teichoic acid export membrane protein
MSNSRTTAAREGGSSEHHLFRSAHALMLNTVLSAALGFGFWVAAARLYSPTLVGINSALIAVMITVSTLSQNNLSIMFTRFLPEATKPAKLIVLGYVTAAGIAAGVATVIVLIAPKLSPNLKVLHDEPWVAAVWVLAVAMWCIFALQDSALTGLRFARVIPIENTVFGVLKIAALLAFAEIGVARGMLFSWVVPMVLLIIPVNLIVFGIAVRRHTPTHDVGIVKSFGKRRLVHYVGLTSVAAICDQGMQAAIPLVVVATLGATQNAFFYVPFTIAMTAELLVNNMITALTVEGAFNAARVRALTAAAARRLAIVTLPISLVLIVAAPLILRFFGPEYVAHGTTVLRLLAVAGLLRGGIWLYMGVCRVQGRAWVIVIQSVITSVGALVLIVVFGNRWGLDGVAFAWLCVNVVVAVGIFPMLWHFLRHPSPEEAEIGDSPVTAQGVAIGDEIATGHPLFVPAEMMGAVYEPDPASVADGALADDGRASESWWAKWAE